MLIHKFADIIPEALPGTCFTCYKPVDAADPGIEWHGVDDRDESVTLLWHARCALHFGLRFMRDIHELDLSEEVVPMFRDKPGTRKLHSMDKGEK